MKIVSMTADHLDQIAALERRCFSVPWSRGMLAQELENDCAAFLVALDGEETVLGYAGLSEEEISHSVEALGSALNP